jgi:hypothetical protein
MDNSPKFSFNFYRFTGTQGNRSTEIVGDYTHADGMRGLVDGRSNIIELAKQRVTDWGTSKGIMVNPLEPFPSQKYPGKVWLEFRFSGLII